MYYGQKNYFAIEAYSQIFAVVGLRDYGIERKSRCICAAIGNGHETFSSVTLNSPPSPVNSKGLRGK